MRAHRIMAVGWSSFLAACALEFLVFACVDPGELRPFGQPLAASRQAIYALCFFAFWGVSALSSALALLLVKGPEELNARGHPRPEPRA